jgi:hypothetical protein
MNATSGFYIAFAIQGLQERPIPHLPTGTGFDYKALEEPSYGTIAVEGDAACR